MAQILQSVSQALKIVVLLQEQPSLGVLDIARALDISSSSAHRLLATLVEANFVVQPQAGGKYALGPAMKGPSSEIERLIEVATPDLVALRDRSQETVHLAVIRGTDTHFVSAVESPRVMRVTSRVGRSLPAHTTAAGKLLLASLSDDELAELYRDHDFSGGTESSIGGLAGLRVEVRLAGARGYGRNLAESEHGVAALAVGLRDAQGRVFASLTVTGPDSLFNPAGTEALSDRERELLEMLTETAAHLESELAATRAGRVLAQGPATNPAASPIR
ncbi:IclR family transcriptional regulator [Subtercola frigoramans]|uniref:DNA-binding IclR family transcriptional regulator n=1 Tax=Subtercola frigoramans TaxID=120298 RepID=A0ABS2L8G5_9MICO|nr:IclR family transcriptional regulator [Subtercola frigoramans]MBM7473015.1 DNA-binding IclR family transcriptional regulator [Subtercola frigoramans]